MLLGLAREREQAEAVPREAFPKSWDGKVHLIWKELPVLWLQPRVRCLPGPLLAGRIVLLLIASNLFLEQLLTEYSQNNPQCRFFQLTNPE